MDYWFEGAEDDAEEGQVFSAAQAPSADISAALCVVGLDRSDAAKVFENCKIWDEADALHWQR